MLPHCKNVWNVLFRSCVVEIRDWLKDSWFLSEPNRWKQRIKQVRVTNGILKLGLQQFWQYDINIIISIISRSLTKRKPRLKLKPSRHNNTSGLISSTSATVLANYTINAEQCYHINSIKWLLLPPTRWHQYEADGRTILQHFAACSFPVCEWIHIARWTSSGKARHTSCPACRISTWTLTLYQLWHKN
jgi:hypothetical protein